MRHAIRWTAAGSVLVVAAVVATAGHVLLSVAIPSCVDPEYRHVAVVPLLCGGLIGIAVVVASVARRSLDPVEREIAIRALARRSAGVPALVMWAAVCATALVVFCVGEGLEQIVAFGHLLPISVHGELLGMLGLFAVCSGVACVILRRLLQLIIVTVAVVVAWLFWARLNLGDLCRSTRETLTFIPPSKQLALESATRRGPPVARALV